MNKASAVGSDLPKGWVRAEIGDLARHVNGRAFKPTEWEESGRPIIRIQNLNDPDARYNYSRKEHEEKYAINSGDLLFAWSASLGAYIWKGGEAWLNQHIFHVKPFSGIDKRYLYYLLSKITAELYAKAHGSGMVHVTKGKFEQTQVSLPPIPEQHRIVAKIEELFSELDKGIESLKTAREQLKVYRQTVLKHAFEGKLTAQWREENKDKLETAEQLLARIQEEREARYQQRLEEWEHVTRKWEHGGKKGKRPSKPRIQTELKTEEEEFSELSLLPDSWNWVLLNDLTEHIVDGTHKTPKYTSSGIYFISAKDIKDFRIGFSNTRFIDEEQHADLAKRCLPKIGNVLITKSGTIGRVAVVETETEFSLFESVANIPTLPPMNPRFLALACFHIIDTYFGVRKQKGVAVRHLHLEDIRRLPIPLPSSSEQLEIAKNLEHIFSMIDHQEMMIDSEITRADVLRQSILKKSFSGQLVPQDPNDEPASVLLERIKAEKAKQAKPSKKKKRKTAA